MRLLALALLLACGPSRPEPDFYVGRVGIAWETALDRPDEARLAALIDHAAAKWGSTPDVLDGWVVTFRLGDGSGWTDRAAREIEVTLLPARLICLEASAFAHEVGHAVLDDPGHSSRAWRDWTLYRAWVETVCPTRAEEADLMERWWTGASGSGGR